MLPLEDQQKFPERSAHCRRVAHLCWLVAEKLGIDAQHSRALLVAATAHGRGKAVASDVGIIKSYGAAEVDLSPVIERSNEILRLWQRRTPLSKGRVDIQMAATALEVCDDFDSAIEFSVYDGTPMDEAISEFFAERGSHEKRVVDALRTFACAKPRLDFDAHLPVMPKAVSRLMRTPAENTTVAELESIASTDPVLTGRLLQAANSAYFGSRHTVLRVDQAIMRVGIAFARKALIAASFGPLFASAPLRELWAHSQKVGAGAHELAGHVGFDQELAYVAGLLHDIGRLITQRCPAALHANEDGFLAAGFPHVYTEHLVYGMDHAAIGGTLLREWGLPAELVEAVSQHHSPESNKSILASILYLAESQAGNGCDAPENLSMNMRRVVACRNAGVPLQETPTVSANSSILAFSGFALSA